MTVQTAGEQKYYDFIGERVRSLRTGMIVWISLLAVALIAGFNNLVMGVILGVAGIFLAVLNIKSQRELGRKLVSVDDKEDFFNQLIAPDAVEMPDLHLLLARDYVLISQPDIAVYRLCDMEKTEVGLGHGGEKALFLTDRNDVRHEVVRTRKKRDAGFDKVYEILKEKCGQKK